MECDKCETPLHPKDRHVIIRGYLDGNPLPGDLLCGDCWSYALDGLYQDRGGILAKLLNNFGGADANVIDVPTNNEP